MTPKILGIVGGVGPQAGIDLHQRILRLTRARADAVHLEVILHTNPLIPDRTAFLLGRGRENPCAQIIRSLDLLAACRCEVVGIPCNTAHAPAILSPVLEHLRGGLSSIRLVQLIDETVAHLRATLPGVCRIGLLATTGTIAARIYQSRLELARIEALVPDPEEQERTVMAAIYDASFGIKARSWPVAGRAAELLRRAGKSLIRGGARALLLGCTELPLALPCPDLQGVPLIVPSEVLAARMVELAAGA